MAANQQQPVTLTLEQAKEAVTALRASLESDDVKAKLAKLKEEAGGDMMKLMTTAMPYAIEVQGHTVQKYGFSADAPGVTKFFMAIQPHMSDTSVKKDADFIRNSLMK